MKTDENLIFDLSGYSLKSLKEVLKKHQKKLTLMTKNLTFVSNQLAKKICFLNQLSKTILPVE